MRILFINSVVDFGSTGKIVRDLADEAKNQGHEVLIAYGRETPLNEEDLFSVVDKPATYFHVAMTRLFGNHGLHSNKATEKLIKKIIEFQPDVINLHNLHGYYINVEMLFDFLATYRVKIYWTLHDCWPFSGSSATFEYHGCKEWDEGCVVCNSTNDYPQVYFVDNQRRNFNWKRKSFTSVSNMTLITPSDWLTELSQTTFLKKYPALTINNGIDLDIFRVKKEKKEGNKFMILGVASYWDERKGLDKFLKLSEMLREDEEIVLVGLSEKDIKKLPENIKGITRTRNIEELADYYNKADVYLNPTTDDNFPTTNLESLACGTPVVTFDTGGSPEAIDQMTGIVTKEKSSEALRLAIDEIRNSEIDYIKECSERAKALYNKKLATLKYIKLFSNGELHE